MNRALRLVCPRCGEEQMYSGLLRMNERCRHCGFKYEREPGYFLGSIYVNYGLTAIISTIVYIGLRFGAGWPNVWVLGPLLVFCIVFPLFFFRYARAYWLAMDCYFDPTVDVQLPETHSDSAE